jgi:uncharacterized repeat protein (TIGR01451 family)
MSSRPPLIAAITASLVAASCMAAGSTQPADAAIAAQTPASCAAAVALDNGGFELPDTPGVAIIDESSVPGWSTTASDGAIELWGPATGVVAGSGDQFAELNANQVSTLYQDVTTVPGQVLKWELQHRGRQGTDVMAVQLGPPSGPLVQQGSNISDGNTAWGSYSGLYTVPAGQTTTRFAFVSVSSTGGSGVGNFLDSISLGNAACVITTKTVTNTSRAGTDAVVGDILEYTIEVANHGGVPATGTVVTDVVPVGTTLVPGSIVGSAGSVTDDPLDDEGEDDSGTVRVRVGDGANASTGGSIPAGESRTVTFQAMVEPGAFGVGVDNEASVSYVESLSGASGSSLSNSVTTPVLASADLQVNQILDTPALANGDPIQYTITVLNGGPQTAADTHLTSALPLTGMTTSDPDCTVTLLQLDCDFGSLANAASRSVVVTGTVPATAAGGTSYQLSSAVSGSTYDPDPTNDTDFSSDLLAEVVSLSITMSITDTAAGSTGRPAYEGDLLQAGYRVTNTGNVDLASLSVTDPFFGPVTCIVTALTPTATTDCTADALYSVTALDVQNGTVSSAVTADAVAPLAGGQAAVATASGSIATGVRPAMALTGSSPAAGTLLAGLLLALGLALRLTAGVRVRRSRS